MARKIETAGQAIDYLGGTAKVAALFGIDPRIISNWRFRGLPPDTYAVMGPALQARGAVFSPQLFSQRAQQITPPPYGDRRKRQSKSLPIEALSPRKLRARLDRIGKSHEEQA